MLRLRSDQLSTNTFEHRACCAAVFAFFKGSPVVPLTSGFFQIACLRDIIGLYVGFI